MPTSGVLGQQEEQGGRRPLCPGSRSIASWVLAAPRACGRPKQLARPRPRPTAVSPELPLRAAETLLTEPRDSPVLGEGGEANVEEVSIAMPQASPAELSGVT